MKIKEIKNQHRRDFVAVMVCEFCNHEQLNKSGYDDRYYHDHVIPEMKCDSCKESTHSKGGSVEFRPTKYPEGFQI